MILYPSRFWIGILCFLSIVIFKPDKALCETCPSKDQVHKTIQSVMKRDVQVISIGTTPYKGICEVYARAGGRDNVFYTDSENKFFMFGHLVESATGKSLTKKALEEYTKLSSKDMQRLKSYTAFTIGKAGVEFFYITDPQCPYCKQGEKILKKMADNGEITVHFVLYPLDFHKGAKEECISVICDNKGLEGLTSGYKSDNQCDEGKNKIEATILFMKEKGIAGTPGYIFKDGIIKKGLIKEPDLRRHLGLSPSKKN